MYKRNVSGNMVLSLVVGLILSFLYAACFADETLAITTYYPSPYGSYQDLYVANTLGIGTTSPQGPLQITAGTGPRTIYNEGSGSTHYNWLTGAQYNISNGFEITPSTAVNGYTFSTPALAVLSGGNVGIGTTSPRTPAPNALAGNLDVNDIYLRSTGKWLSQSGSGGSGVTMLSARSASTYNHPNACAYCYNLSAAAALAMNGDTTTVYTDWRIPTVEETAVFEGVISEGTYYYWTASFVGTVAVNWAMRKFTDGYWNYGSWDGLYYVRCVR